MPLKGTQVYLGGTPITLIKDDKFQLIDPLFISGFDSDAEAFINATGITGTEATALNQLVLDLKSAGVWTKLDAIYPMVGTTFSTQGKYNLKDPRDLDAAYRLTSNGTISYSSSYGIGTNGTSTSYFNTNWNTSTDATFNSTTFAIWETNTGAWSGTTIPYGAFDEPNADGIFLTPDIAGSGFARGRMYVNAADESVNEGDGMWLLTNNGTTTYLYKNGVQQANVSDNNSGVTLANLDVHLGRMNNTGANNYPAPIRCRFACLGTYLDSTEQSDLYTAVNTFNTTIGR